jgi:DNA mismatch endonuclease (patch repair protein)
MLGNRKTDTRPEIALRSALHRTGNRFRKNHSVRVDDGRPITIDVAFPKAKLAVFVDGCFWHSCAEHGTEPRSNLRYWGPKLKQNIERDREVDRRLIAGGWEVLRVWEHEVSPSSISHLVAEVQRTLRALRDA